MKNKLLPALILAVCVSGACINAEVPSTGKVDDYTNGKNGVESNVYKFSINGSEKMAFGKGSNSTDMTWGQWLNINAEKFNTDGYYQVTTNGGSSPAKNMYYVKYNINKPYSSCSVSQPNNDAVYAGGNVSLPSLSCKGYRFDNWWSAASGGNSFNGQNIGSNQTVYAHWTANELDFKAQTKEFNYSESVQTWKISAPTTGTGSYTYKMSAVNGFSISSDGTITISAKKNGGVYSLPVTVTDTNSKKTSTKTITIRIKPVLNSNAYQLAWGDKELDIYMLGLKDGAKATSSEATMTLTNGNLVLKTTLNNAFTDNKNLNFKITVDGYAWDYSVSLTKTAKVLTVLSPVTTFNNEQQIPMFYEEDPAYRGQSNFFKWTVCKEGETCTSTSQKDAGSYKINLSTISSAGKEIRVYDKTGNKVSSTTIDFRILPFKLTSENTKVKVNNANVTYNGQSIVPDLTVTTTINGKAVTLVNQKDYIISSSNSVNEHGTFDISIKGISNYQGEVVNAGQITIAQKNVDNLTYSWEKEAFWTGSEIKPAVIVSYNGINLIENTDYTLKYENNINVGTGKITVTGKGNYSGTKVLNFNIKPNEFGITIADGYAIYTGTATTGGADVKVNNHNSPTIKFGTSNGKYDLTSMPKFTDVGKHTVYWQVSANGFSTKSGTLTIEIVKDKDEIKLNKSSVELVMPTSQDVTFTTKSGSTVSLTGQKHTKVSVSGNKITLTPLSAGEDVITVKTTGNANFESATTTLYVKVKNGTIKVTASDNKLTYDGNSHSISLKYDPTDAKIIYSWEEQGVEKTSSTLPSFTNAGTYLISYSISKTYYDPYYGTNKLIINAKNITAGMVSLDQNEFTFTGAAMKPNVTVKDGNTTLVENKDYTVKYVNNVNPSENAQVIVTGTGNYSGEITKTFKIKAAEIKYTKQNGIASFTGYGTFGKNDASDKCTATGCKAEVVVSYPASSYTIAFSKTKPVCQNGSATCVPENKNYNETTMPRFKNVGTHTVWFRITATGHKTIEDTLTVTINKKVFDVPTLFGDYLYTGQVQSPSWLNYNSKFMEMKGDLEATAAGTYTTTFRLTDKVNTEWKDGSTTDKQVQWEIKKISIKDHELVVDNDIAYNEVKQPYVSEGKIKFERTGYNQVAWVESCEDVMNDALGIDDRKCNYSKYSFVKTNEKTKETCENKGGVWIANTGVCQKERLNYYDVGSSFSGTYIADYLGYDTEKVYNLYATWSKVMYRVEYDLCDGKGCGIDPGNPTFASYDSAIKVTNPEREGYLFMGWEITGMDKTPHVIGEDTVTDETFTVPEEWIGLTQAEKIGQTISMKNLTSIEGATVKLKAIWQPIKYTIIFDNNKQTFRDDLGNVTQANTSGYTPNMTNVTYDIVSTLNKNQFTMAGYKFTGWTTTRTGKAPNGTACTLYSDETKGKEYIGKDNRCLSFKDEQQFQNLTVTEGDVITLYAQWERLNDVKFTVTFWKQNITDGTAHNSTNFQMVGIETYQGTADSLITLKPYTYKGNNQSAPSAGKIVNTSRDTGNKAHMTINKKSGVTPTFISTTNNKLIDDFFRGFTLQGADANEYGEYRGINNRNEHSYIISPNGTTNINVYYTRNTYRIVYQMNGGTTSNPTSRKYQVAVTFNNPSDNNSLKNGRSDEGGTHNSGQANFAGWFANSNITVQVYGINGEVTTDAEVFAKWLQYRYSGANGNESSWTSWGRINE